MLKSIVHVLKSTVRMLKSIVHVLKSIDASESGQSQCSKGSKLV